MKHYRPVGNHDAHRADKLDHRGHKVLVPLPEAEEALRIGYRLPAQLPEYRKLMAYQDLARMLPVVGTLHAQRVHRAIRVAWETLSLQGAPLVDQLVDEAKAILQSSRQ